MLVPGWMLQFVGDKERFWERSDAALQNCDAVYRKAGRSERRNDFSNTL